MSGFDISVGFAIIVLVTLSVKLYALKSPFMAKAGRAVMESRRVIESIPPCLQARISFPVPALEGARTVHRVGAQGGRRRGRG